MSEKFTACLTHEDDKKRIVAIREEGGMSEKDTITAILDAAEPHIAEIVAGLKAMKNAVKAAQIANRTAKYEENRAISKAVRASMRAPIATSGASAASESAASEQVTVEPALRPLGEVVKQHVSKRKGFTPAVVETEETFVDPNPATI